MSSHMSPSLSSLASNSTTSSSSPINGLFNTPTCTASPKNSSRKPLANQHPLAIVSNIDSDHESISDYYHTDSNTYSNTTQQAQIHTRSSESMSVEASNNNTMDDRASVSELSIKGSIPTTGLPRPLESKQNDLSALKSAIRSGSSHILTLQIKSEGASGTNNAQDPNSRYPSNNQNFASMEPKWNGSAVTSGVDQPISPLTVLRPTMPSSSLVLTKLTEDGTTAQATARQASQPPTMSSATPALPSPQHESDKWAPPPRSSRRPGESQRQEPTHPPSHSRLPIPRLLKQRSFNSPFTSSNPGLRSTHGSINDTPAERASVDDSSRPTGSTSTSQSTRTAALCDIPRPIGPPDPIPLHYQHLQNRENRISTSFRRRSHGGELDRFPAGWTVSENTTSSQTTPRASIGDDQSSEARHSSTFRRHASLGVRPNSSSMWGRLLTSIFSSSGSERGDQGTPRRNSEGGIPDLYAQPERLLLTPVGQQNQSAHPPCQQQLFFYADEVIDRLERSDSDHSFAQDEEYFGPRSSEDSSGEDAPSFFQGPFTSDANVQGEFAQGDRRESIEVMMNPHIPEFVRPDTPSQLFGDGFVVPRTLSVDGKIPVSCLALSSPPSYWEAAVKYQGWPRIDPRPEQGEEALPRYTCSVFREGCVNRKTELIGNWRPYRRPWK
ncbi:hypothetical protein BGX20_003124 [Mortierella sp. AD010]|nr:hypothetical protein BGX20_003124 [Mortierella sp. AD010]